MEFHQKYRGKMVIFKDITVNIKKDQGQKGNFTLLPPKKRGIRENTGEKEREEEKGERVRRKRKKKKRKKEEKKEKEEEEERKKKGEEERKEEEARGGRRLAQVDLWATSRRTPAERDQHLSSEICS
ncbi:unnamed protein product [Victoria cruziana]